MTDNDHADFYAQAEEQLRESVLKKEERIYTARTELGKALLNNVDAEAAHLFDPSFPQERLRELTEDGSPFGSLALHISKTRNILTDLSVQKFATECRSQAHAILLTVLELTRAGISICVDDELTKTELAKVLGVLTSKVTAELDEARAVSYAQFLHEQSDGGIRLSAAREAAAQVAQEGLWTEQESEYFITTVIQLLALKRLPIIEEGMAAEVERGTTDIGDLGAFTTKLLNLYNIDTHVGGLYEHLYLKVVGLLK